MWFFPVYGRSGKPEGTGVNWKLKHGAFSINEEAPVPAESVFSCGLN